MGHSRRVVSIKFDTQIDAKIPNITMTPMCTSFAPTAYLDRDYWDYRWEDKNDRPYLMYRYERTLSHWHGLYNDVTRTLKLSHRIAKSAFQWNWLHTTIISTGVSAKQGNCEQQLPRVCPEEETSLQEYLLALMNIAPDEVASNVHVLTFLGAIRTTNQYNKKYQTKQKRC